MICDCHTSQNTFLEKVKKFKLSYLKNPQKSKVLGQDSMVIDFWEHEGNDINALCEVLTQFVKWND